MAGDDEEPPTFNAVADEARYYRVLAKDRHDELEDMRLALEDFRSSSKDLEDEMERDLAVYEKRENDLRQELDKVRHDIDTWKSRHQTTLKEHATTLSHMHKELDSLRASERALRARLRDMELDNDDLEKSERAISSTLEDVESRYNKAVERTALLEEELVDKARLEEELQRVKDELRDTYEELAFAQHQQREQQIAIALPSVPEPVETPKRAQVAMFDDHSRVSTSSASSVPSPDIDSTDGGDRCDRATVSSAQAAARMAQIRASPSKIPSSSSIKRLSQLNLQSPAANDFNNIGVQRSSQMRDFNSAARAGNNQSPVVGRPRRTTDGLKILKDATATVSNIRQTLSTHREVQLSKPALPRSISSRAVGATASTIGHARPITARVPSIAAAPPDRQTVSRQVSSPSPFPQTPVADPYARPASRMSLSGIPRTSRPSSRMSGARPETPSYARSVASLGRSAMPPTSATYGLRSSKAPPNQNEAGLSRRVSMGSAMSESKRLRKTSLQGAGQPPLPSPSTRLRSPSKSTIPQWR